MRVNSADKQFEDLCFDFGIELEEVTSERELAEKNNKQHTGLSDKKIYRIDIPANRYDLLCVEGIARALKTYLGIENPPGYRLAETAIHRIHISGSTSPLRPFVVAAVLRNITFDAQSYASFIDLQDKLHNNICR
jgi:phenylalanyl-tRNA synthetase beta chain